MNQLKTVFSSNSPVDCYIIKGRLESEGIKCFVFDEYLIWVHPFRAVAIGGVKLKVHENKLSEARMIMDSCEHNLLLDEDGYYELREVFTNEYYRQNEILEIRSLIRSDESLLSNGSILPSSDLSDNELLKIIQSEKEFLEQSRKKNHFSWKRFWYELLDSDRNIFDYLRLRNSDYYIEKELVDNFLNQKPDTIHIVCPICGSKNVTNGTAIDYGWSVIQIVSIIVALLFFAVPMFLFRRKNHCYDCGNNFK